MFEVVKHDDYYVIKDVSESIYVSGFRKGEYTFTEDVIYARRYTENTAIMHKDILNGRD